MARRNIQSPEFSMINDEGSFADYDQRPRLKARRSSLWIVSYACTHMEIRPIRSVAGYQNALHRVEALWGSAPGTAPADELDILVTLIEAYEREQYPIDPPNPIDAIKFRLEQEGKDYRSLIGVIGQRTRVYEVMRGDRPLSLNMIRKLHRKFRIPAEVLIQPSRRTRLSGRKRNVSANRRRKNPALRDSA